MADGRPASTSPCSLLSQFPDGKHPVPRCSLGPSRYCVKNCNPSLPLSLPPSLLACLAGSVPQESGVVFVASPACGLLEVWRVGATRWMNRIHASTRALTVRDVMLHVRHLM